MWSDLSAHVSHSQTHCAQPFARQVRCTGACETEDTTNRRLPEWLIYVYICEERARRSSVLIRANRSVKFQFELFHREKKAKRNKKCALKLNLRFADKVETHRVHANCAENKCEIIYALHMERHRQFEH